MTILALLLYTLFIPTLNNHLYIPVYIPYTYPELTLYLTPLCFPLLYSLDKMKKILTFDLDQEESLLFLKIYEMSVSLGFSKNEACMLIGFF